MFSVIVKAEGHRVPYTFKPLETFEEGYAEHVAYISVSHQTRKVLSTAQCVAIKFFFSKGMDHLGCA